CGIGPTHGDITADCVATAFGVPIDRNPRALAILADLILNKVSGAPGFWISNVIVMAGVPSIMQAMLDEVAPKLRVSVRMLSETVRADAREGDIGVQLGEIAKANLFARHAEDVSRSGLSGAPNRAPRGPRAARYSPAAAKQARYRERLRREVALIPV